MKAFKFQCVTLGLAGFFALVGAATAAELPPPIAYTTQQDHQAMKDLLQIKTLRPGRYGLDPKATNYANYDESKANPFL